MPRCRRGVLAVSALPEWFCIPSVTLFLILASIFVIRYCEMVSPAVVFIRVGKQKLPDSDALFSVGT